MTTQSRVNVVEETKVVNQCGKTRDVGAVKMVETPACSVTHAKHHT